MRYYGMAADFGPGERQVCPLMKGESWVGAVPEAAPGFLVTAMAYSSGGGGGGSGKKKKGGGRE